jgi:hypothetical protein
VSDDLSSFFLSYNAIRSCHRLWIMWNAEHKVTELLRDGEPTYGGFLHWLFPPPHDTIQKTFRSFFGVNNRDANVDIIKKSDMRRVIFEMLEYLYADHLVRDSSFYLADSFESTSKDPILQTFFDLFTALSFHHAIIETPEGHGDQDHSELHSIFTLCRFAPFLDVGMWIRNKTDEQKQYGGSWTRSWLMSCFAVDNDVSHSETTPKTTLDRPLYRWTLQPEYTNNLLYHIDNVCKLSSKTVEFTGVTARTFEAQPYLVMLIECVRSVEFDSLQMKKAVNCILTIFWLCADGEERKEMLGYIVVVIFLSKKDDADLWSPKDLQEHLLLNFAPVVHCMYIECKINNGQTEDADELFETTMNDTVVFLDMMMHGGHHFDSSLEDNFNNVIIKFPSLYEEPALEVLRRYILLPKLQDKFSTVDTGQTKLNFISNHDTCFKTNQISTWSLMYEPRSYEEFTSSVVVRDNSFKSWKYEEDYRDKFQKSRTYLQSCVDGICTTLYCRPNIFPLCDESIKEGQGCKYQKKFFSIGPWKKTCPIGTVRHEVQDGWVYCEPQREQS